jgi:hypothetical protein
MLRKEGMLQKLPRFLLLLLMGLGKLPDLIQIYDDLLTCKAILQIHGDHSRNW